MLAKKCAERLKQVVIDLLKPVGEKVHTLTSDFGKDFAENE
jgi:hypothetical protein